VRELLGDGVFAGAYRSCRTTKAAAVWPAPGTDEVRELLESAVAVSDRLADPSTSGLEEAPGPGGVEDYPEAMTARDRRRRRTPIGSGWCMLKGSRHGRGFTFFTGYESRKETRSWRRNRGRRSVFHWRPLRRPGCASRAAVSTASSGEESDAYWATRPPGSRAAAGASTDRGEAIASRDEALEAEFERLLPGEVPRRSAGVVRARA
jgi:hypothetical protein